MKPFNFERMEAKIHKRNQKQLNEQNGNNFLKLYQDIPGDPIMDAYISDVKQQFDQKRKNSRYYSYELQNNKDDTLSSSKALLLSQIRKLSYYKMPYRANQKSQKQIQIQTNKQRTLEQQQAKTQKRMKNLNQIKFKSVIRLIIGKMKKMKITIEDIITKDLFSKEAYKFGTDIFIATKEGNPERVWTILMQNKFNIFNVDNTQKSPLMWSCIRDQPKITKTLLEFGADSSRKDINQLDALNYALRYNSTQCIKLLMLELAPVDQSHHIDTLKAHQSARKVFNVAVGLLKMFKRLNYQKRMGLFQQHYDYLYK